MGGKTPTRLVDSCEMYLEADEMAIYEAWIKGNKQVMTLLFIREHWYYMLYICIYACIYTYIYHYCYICSLTVSKNTSVRTLRELMSQQVFLKNWI